MTETWQRLTESHDLFSDLCDIYTPEFYATFADRFDRAPNPSALENGVHETAEAYLMGKWRKRADNSALLKYSGVHLMGAGLAARRLASELTQVAKSDLASTVITIRTGKKSGSDKPYGRVLEAARLKHLGPQVRLRSIIETCAALEEAIATLIDLPDDATEEPNERQRALDFAESFNANHEKELSKNHAVESAALAFQPVWEEFSTVRYARGRYKHERGGYDSAPVNALYEIINQLDSMVARSLVGTAIENIRKRT